MFNSASDILPPPPPKALGKDPSTLATDEHGRPVPYLAGRARLGLTWISEPWGVRSVPVRKKVGKKRQTVGYNYFASFAGMLCVGPAQTLHAIIVDDETAWEGPLNAGSNDSAEITVEGRGSLTLYWGTTTQGVDAELAGSGAEHPAYRGQCYVVFNDWLLGENRSQVPGIQFELTRLPVVSWLAVSAGLNGEVNPIAALGELMTDPRFGAGLPSSALDTVGWNAVATQLFNDGFSLSVFLDQVTRLDGLLNDFLEYLDAALYHTPAGKLAADGGVGVVAQAVDIADGDQEQIQGPRARFGAAQVMVADQAVVHPTEAGRDLAQPIRPRRMLVHHTQGSGVVDVVSGRPPPRMLRPRSSSWRALVAMSSCNVVPVTIERSPINAGCFVRESSCNASGTPLVALRDD